MRTAGMAGPPPHLRAARAACRRQGAPLRSRGEAPCPGALLGILLHRADDPDRPFGPLTPFAETVARLARSQGVVVSVFAPWDVDPERGSVRQLIWTGSGWRSQGGPLPPVVWNRYFRRDEADLVAALKRRGVALLNETRLDKWETYCRLSQDPVLAECLPETRLLDGGESIFAMLERHPVLFIKPVGGSIGRGIIRALPGGLDVLRLQYVSAWTGSLREVYAGRRQLERWAAGRSGQFILQQGIPLAAYRGRPADIRALVQKDGRGCWLVTGMGARVAARGRFTTNLHTGGSGLPLEEYLRVAFPGEGFRQTTIWTRLVELALRVPPLIEAGGGRLGELGLDFGLDGTGKIWFIEQNAQPGRSIFERLGRRDLFELAHLRPIQYARFLAAGGQARLTAADAT